MATEIERKFVAESRPAAIIPGLRGTHMRQGYLAENGSVTVRVRIADDWAKLTVKAGSAEARTEVEVDIEPTDAEELWAFTEGRRIVKTRFRIPLDDERPRDEDGDALVAEVDVFEGDLAGLCIVEVEFESLDDAKAFDPPPWFGRDVTGVKGWSNADLARNGLPDD